MNRLSKALITAIAVVAAVSGFSPASQQAHAATLADTCAGSQVGGTMTSTHPATGEVIALTRAYQGDGKFCVVSVKQNSYYGKNTYMELHMFKSNGNHVDDNGNFLYMAGPIRMTNNGMCVSFEIDLWNGPKPGSTNIVQQNSGWINC
jgi:hypothetical protein